MTSIKDDMLDRLFRTARSRNGWRDEPISHEDIRAIYELCKWGPTSGNSSPARFIWVTSADAKLKLADCASETNARKIRAAPATVVIARAKNFHERLPDLFPHGPYMYELMRDNLEIREATARRNATLQGAYLMMAARALGFDCGPMSGFDENKVNQLYFPDGDTEVDFLCSIGHGSDDGLFERLPRLSFDEASRII